MDEYEPLEEGLLPVSEKRIVSSLLVKLRVGDPGTLKNEDGYMDPKPVDFQTEDTFLKKLEGYTQRREEKKQYRQDRRFENEFPGFGGREDYNPVDQGRFRRGGAYPPRRNYNDDRNRDFYDDRRDFMDEGRPPRHNDFHDNRRPDYRDDRQNYSRGRGFNSGYRNDYRDFRDERRDGFRDDRRDFRPQYYPQNDYRGDRPNFRGGYRDEYPNRRDGYRRDEGIICSFRLPRRYGHERKELVSRKGTTQVLN